QPGPGPVTYAWGVGAGLPPLDGAAGGVDEARLARAQERHHARHLGYGAESAERHLAPDELLQGRRILLHPPVPSAALPQDRARRDAVHGDAASGHLAPERGHEADLPRLGGVVGGRAAGLATPDR